MCDECGKRFTTYEKIEDMPLIVRKRSGRTELFDKAKILRGLAKAWRKTSVTIDQLEEMVDNIEKQLKNNYTEVSTSEIGQTIPRAPAPSSTKWRISVLRRFIRIFGYRELFQGAGDAERIGEHR